MRNVTELTVIIATYNRAEDLHKTLEAMCTVDRQGLSVVFIVADNNSTDETESVVQSFSDRLAVQYVFASRPGKSRALNHVLKTADLGEIVVFADDDITPCANWLLAIKDACQRWQDHCVFGGRVEPTWPDGQAPRGLRSPGARKYGLGLHEYGAQDREYPSGVTGLGANWWVRRGVLAGGRRFDESIGPVGGSVIMGEDSAFMKGLLRDGHRIVFVPKAMVRHRIQRKLVTPLAIMRRAFSLGRGGPHVGGVCQPKLLERFPIAWYGKRSLVLSWSTLRYLVSYLGLSSESAVAMRLSAAEAVGYNLESLAIARRSKRAGSTLPGQNRNGAP